MRVLIVGLGSIARKHIAALKTIEPTVQLIAYRHSVESVQVEGIQNIYSLDNLDGSKFDFFIISNPTAQHKETLNSLIKYRKPIFLEKPLHSSLTIKPLIEKINSLDIQTYVACNMRFLESIKYARDIIKRNEMGQLNEVNVYCGSYLPDWRPGSDFRRSYSADSDMGGGVHLDLIHELDYIYWIFGYPNNIHRHFKSQSSLKIEAIDYANYLLEYEGFCANIVLNYFRKYPKRTLEMVFDKGTIHVDLLANTVENDEGLLFSTDKRTSDTYLSQIQYFIGCVRNKEKTMNTVNDAYNVLKICLKNDSER